MDSQLEVTSCLLPSSDEQTSSTSPLAPRKMSSLSVASSTGGAMSRKRSISERMKEVEAKLRSVPKKPTPPSIFEAAAMIGKFSGQRIDLLSGKKHFYPSHSAFPVCIHTYY
ncbi:unnamed protein product [Auanema sp. JU1783]|nr:unnamed protein product [Auanema sp. JU1783]